MPRNAEVVRHWKMLLRIDADRSGVSVKQLAQEFGVDPAHGVARPGGAAGSRLPAGGREARSHDLLDADEHAAQGAERRRPVGDRGVLALPEPRAAGVVHRHAVRARAGRDHEEDREGPVAEGAGVPEAAARRDPGEGGAAQEVRAEARRVRGPADRGLRRAPGGQAALLLGAQQSREGLRAAPLQPGLRRGRPVPHRLRPGVPPGAGVRGGAHPPPHRARARASRRWRT